MVHYHFKIFNYNLFSYFKVKTMLVVLNFINTFHNLFLSIYPMEASQQSLYSNTLEIIIIILGRELNFNLFHNTSTFTYFQFHIVGFSFST